MQLKFASKVLNEVDFIVGLQKCYHLRLFRLTAS